MAQLAPTERAVLLERFRHYLRDQHLPVTRQRDLVAEIVFLSEDHLSVDEIERRIRVRGERVGTATVYRTLDVLVQSGLVRAHDFGQGFKRYEPMLAPSVHEHLICERCGSVNEFRNEQLERMLHLIADERNFHHRRHRVEVYGLCPACRQLDLESI
jgi:Fur family ferric uptake transcriptional regulator